MGGVSPPRHAGGEQVDDLDPLTSRVLAPNPSVMTLDGTNSYLIGAPGDGAVVCVDPGPRDERHRDALERAAAARDAEIVAVVLTHHHADHAEAADWAASWGAPVHAFTPSMVADAAGSASVRELRDGDRLAVAGVTLETVHTPGHASDHVCLRVADTDVVLSGDHVLGRGSTVVAWPDGDLASYLVSLRRLRETGAAALYPGHGPVVTRPREVVDEYLAHRAEREREVLAALRAGARGPAEVVARVYADVDPALHPAAERSVRAHLDKLVAEGRVARDPGGGPGGEEAFDVR